MAAAKKPTVKVVKIAPAKHRRIWASPDARKWRRWCHDVDAILHELVKNPALAAAKPADIIARAAAFADAYQAMQDRRRPAGLEEYF